MIITSGYAKGLKLSAPKGIDTRPTGAKTREAVMSMLLHDIEGALFYDFFCGSGAMGIEALSRGAKEAIFVDSSKEAFSCLKKNISEFDRRLTAQKLPKSLSQVYNQEVEKFLDYNSRDLKSKESSQDKLISDTTIIWGDPPYADTVNWVELMFEKYLGSLQRAHSHFIVECDSKDVEKILNLSEKYPQWEAYKVKKYGKAAILRWCNGF